MIKGKKEGMGEEKDDKKEKEREEKETRSMNRMK